MTRGEWKRVVVLDTKYRKQTLAIKVGADNPDHLLDTDVMKGIKELARRKGYKKVRGAGHVKLFGQNELAQRVFYYTR
jgi:hypothetical protein